MLDFKYMDIPDGIKETLQKYHIDFAFQPIYYKNKTLFGYEALMRPVDMNIEDLLQYAKEHNLLHEIELLSFFGGTLAYGLRGYTEKLCINSIPSECMTETESNAYSECFKDILNKLIVELVEYSDYESWACRIKQAQIKSSGGIWFSIDDFGTGNNDINRVKQIAPQIVKLDRSLISNINEIKSMQRMVDQLVFRFHEMGIKVLAEGVETKEEYEYLLTTDVDLYQGYYLGKPL